MALRGRPPEYRFRQLGAGYYAGLGSDRLDRTWKSGNWSEEHCAIHENQGLYDFRLHGKVQDKERVSNESSP